MPLTKTQRELLTILKQFPTAQIINPSYRAAYLEKDGGRVKTINHTNLGAILPYLKPMDGRRNIYIFDPEAEISDDWPAKDRERRRLENKKKEEARLAKVQEEADKAAAWFECDGPYTVDFSGEWFTGGGVILFGSVRLASIHPVRQSGDDQTFEAIIKRPENLERMSHIKEMLQRANRGINAER